MVNKEFKQKHHRLSPKTPGEAKRGQNVGKMVKDGAGHYASSVVN
jgi:hypothetical protein